MLGANHSQQHELDEIVSSYTPGLEARPIFAAWGVCDQKHACLIKNSSPHQKRQGEEGFGLSPASEPYGTATKPIPETPFHRSCSFLHVILHRFPRHAD